jgi:TonB family protein
MTGITQAFGAALLHFIWQGSLAAAILWVALKLLERRSASLRYVLCCGVLGVLAALPLITTSVLYDPASPVVISRVAGDVPEMVNLTVTAPPMRHVDRFALVGAWAVPLWSLGVLFFSARMIWGCRQIAALKRLGEPAGEKVLSLIASHAERMRVSKPIRVLVSALPNGPSVVGWLRPVILLPAAAIAGLTPPQLEAVLAHEMAHIRRHDYLVNLLQMAVEALLFYHPAVWWISGRIRAEREFCCDDLVVRTCRDAVGYARALSILERLRLEAPEPALGSTGGPLLQRIQRIVGAPMREHGPSLLPAILAVALGLVCLTVNVRLVHGQATDDDGSVLVSGKNLQIVSRTPIEYPASARAAGKQGLVVVGVEIGALGNVLSAEVQKPPDNQTWAPKELEDAAVASIRTWHFAPVQPAETAPRMVVVLFQADPKSANAYMTSGDLLFRAGQVDDALQRYEAGAQEHPEKKIDFLKRETEVYIRKGDTATALAKDEEILQLDPHDAEARGLQASYELDAGHVDEALKELEEVVTAIPSNFVAHFNLGRAYFAKGEMDRARAQFSATLRMRPNYVSAYRERAKLEVSRHNYGEALRDTKELLRLSQAGQAREIIEQVLKADPQNAEALAQKKSLGDDPTGPRGAVPEQPAGFRAHYDLGQVLMAQKHFGYALEEFSKALSARPDFVPARIARAKMKALDHDYSGALQDVDAALLAVPDDASAQVLKAHALAHLGRFEDARTILYEVLALDPANREASDEQKWIDRRALEASLMNTLK